VSAGFLVVQALNGVAYGLLIFLLAIGLSLVFGMLHVLTLAHGSFFMLGAYIGYTVYTTSNSFWLAVIAAPILVGALGVLVEIFFLKKLYDRPLLDQVVLTFGMSFIVTDFVRRIWGANELVLPAPDSFDGSIQVLGNTYPEYRLFVIGVGMIPRGEVGLIFARIGLASRVFDPGLFGAVTLMVMMTTLVVPPCLERLLDHSARSRFAEGAQEGIEDLVTEA